MTQKPMICTLCNGEMVPYTGKRYSGKVSGFMIIAGIGCTLFWVGAVLGLPLLIAGIIMRGAKRELWVCEDCKAAIERIELRPLEKAKVESVASSKSAV